MKIKYITLAFLLILASCNESKKTTKEEKYLKESYKEQKSDESLSKHSEHFDSLTNIYSNYKYLISIDAPDHWEIDFGTAKHSIFRGNDPELALTFSIVVVEPKTELKHSKNAWEFYLDNKTKQDAELKTIVKTQFNSEIQNYKANKSYIRNIISANHAYDFLVKSTDLEYLNHVINHQIYNNDYIYTLTAHMPKIVYDEQPEYFERLFNLITFLPHSEKINE
ncbi:hypothetical protein [Psychroserpens ponticola]|uniref:PsbP C-terminal domain-containing protein n=1 Tax=Psychroserpens ponticola TaxID=2932268 RepID=A0ABY7S2G6_9FLAO|nr:hypothetical protein [Psychroserpens ponticola]WCO02656.1 hypothetical protein MUN68_003965 [Psychroserpens ponticola]